MIIVKIELHSANTGKITPLGEMHLSNTGDSLPSDSLHSYDVEIMRKGSPTKVQRRGLVQNYPRNNYTVWELVKRALIAGLGKHPIHPGTPEEFDEQVSAEEEIPTSVLLDVVVKQLENPNSKVSRSLAKLQAADRRRM